MTKSNTALVQMRLKNAADAYKVHKSIYIDPVYETPLEGFLPWPEFRDQFLADWQANRRVVTEKEADVIFDRIADESLSELGGFGPSVDVNQAVDQISQNQADDDEGSPGPTTTATSEPSAPPAITLGEQAPSAPKAKRGRPAGSASKEAKKAKPSVVKSAKAHAKKAKKAAKRVTVAKKGSNTSVASKAQTLIARYQERGWERKRILEKLEAQLGVGSAYASTLYQKFHK